MSIPSSIFGLQRVLPGLLLIAVFTVLPAKAELDLAYHEEELQPDIELRDFENRTVEEYRINGNLYMIRITPKFGPAYYLVDDTGTGELDLRRTAYGRDIVIPRWTLLTW